MCIKVSCEIYLVTPSKMSLDDQTWLCGLSENFRDSKKDNIWPYMSMRISTENLLLHAIAVVKIYTSLNDVRPPL